MGPADVKHVTRDNVDKYFLLDERHEGTVLTKNLTQMKDVIQFCTDFYEYLPPQPMFMLNPGLLKNVQRIIVVSTQRK